MLRIEPVPYRRHLAANENHLGRCLEKMSSGLRINRASDDAAGLAISETLRAQTLGFQQIGENLQNSISLLQTAELQAIQESLQRLRTLTAAGASDALSRSEREAIQSEIDEIRQGINQIGEGTSFNGLPLITGQYTETPSTISHSESFSRGTRLSMSVSAKTLTTTRSAPPGEEVQLQLSSAADTYHLSDGLSPKGLRVFLAGSEVSFDATDGFTYDPVTRTVTLHGASNPATPKTITVCWQSDGTSDERYPLELPAEALADEALAKIAAARGKIAGRLNGHATQYENTVNMQLRSARSESVIRDADMAKENLALVRSRILTQSGLAIATQSNHLKSQQVLALFRPPER